MLAHLDLHTRASRYSSAFNGCYLSLKWLLHQPSMVATSAFNGCYLSLQWLLPQPSMVATSAFNGCYLSLQWLLPQPSLLATSTFMLTISRFPNIFTECATIKLPFFTSPCPDFLYCPQIILLIILNRFLSDGAWREVVLVIASVQADSVDVGLTPKSADARALLHR